jgi:hypothetical protein
MPGGSSRNLAAVFCRLHTPVRHTAVDVTGAAQHIGIAQAYFPAARRAFLSATAVPVAVNGLFGRLLAKVAAPPPAKRAPFDRKPPSVKEPRTEGRPDAVIPPLGPRLTNASSTAQPPSVPARVPTGNASVDGTSMWPMRAGWRALRHKGGFSRSSRAKVWLQWSQHSPLRCNRTFRVEAKLRDLNRAC